MDLQTAADELYGHPASDFGPRRAELIAQAKRSSDRTLVTQLQGLRKPVAAAALVNVLVRAEHPEIAELTQLAARLRSAHRELQGSEIRALSATRHQLLNRLLDLAVEAGPLPTAAVLGQVRQTFEAAIADEAAHQAVLSGQLTKALLYSGFGDTDFSAAVAVPRRPRHLRVVPSETDEKPARGTANAQSPAGEADRGVADAQRLAADADRRVAEAQRLAEARWQGALVEQARADQRTVEAQSAALLAASAREEAASAVAALEEQLQTGHQLLLHAEADLAAAYESLRKCQDVSARAAAAANAAHGQTQTQA